MCRFFIANDFNKRYESEIYRQQKLQGVKVLYDIRPRERIGPGAKSILPFPVAGTRVTPVPVAELASRLPVQDPGRNNKEKRGKC